MARLNDPPAPIAESVDALKRRFIRQNREIARVNSNQSIRIRNLEAEISRLLAENIAIREEAIAAKVEADKYASSKRLERELLYLKDKFEAKLSEVNNLVGDLGRLPERAARRSSMRKRKSGILQESTKSSIDPEWRNRQTASGIDRDVQEARMPAIVEDKYYPRRTLDVNELKPINDDITYEPLESPDLGPPPVVHFEDSECFASDAPQPQRRISREFDTEFQDGVTSATVNLETRRKRRTSTLLQDITNMPEEQKADTKSGVAEPEKKPIQEATAVNVPPRQQMKASMKRKLDVSELEDTSGKANRDLDDFIFQRRPSMSKPAIKSTRFGRAAPNLNETNSNNAPNFSPAKQSPVRKILAPKSTNSPSKRQINAVTEQDVKGKTNDGEVAKPLQTKSRTKLASIKAPEPQTTSLTVADATKSEQGVEESLPPKTPAAELTNLLSPQSVPTEPSTKTKSVQEMAITNSVEDVLNGSIGRGSRRARAAVSYAEPNLRDKMRRPGKELVGAVEGLPKSKNTDRSSLVGASEVLQLEGRRDTIGMPSTSKPTQDTEEDAYARDGTSNRGNFSLQEEAPSPLRGKIASVSRDMDGRARSQTRLVKPVSRDNEISDALSNLAIFDPPTSSPISEEKIAKEEHKAASGSRPNSRTRRHSTQLQTFQQLTGVERPNSAASMRAQSANKDGSTRRSASVTSLPPVGILKTTSTNRKPVEKVASNTTLTRRKSMMI